jgi:threonine/homoserine/homoserine lactone efflux protein
VTTAADGMDPHVWLAFVAASAVMGLAPGPAVTSIVGYALSSGRATALASVAGMAVGNVIAMSLSLPAYRIQALILVATFVLVVALTDTLYALAASGAARLLRRPSAARWMERAGAGVLTATGAATAVSRT